MWRDLGGRNLKIEAGYSPETWVKSYAATLC
jgi:hypothetical protein